VTAPRYTLQELFRAMAERGASDLYLKAGTPPMYRIAGIVETSGLAAPLPGAMDGLVGGIMNEAQHDALRRNGHADFAYWEQSLGRFRVNVYLQRGSVALVARRVRSEIPSMEELQLPAVLGEFAMMPRGLVVVTGPAGAGKSTTLAAMLEHRNRIMAGHIITIEDPIEFLHADRQSIVSQREIGTDADSFASALRGALRQTPDVLLIGEMRDADSAQAGVYFAETGHLVLSTLHTINANQALNRLVHFFPPEIHEEIFLRLSATLVGIVAQRLIARADGSGMVPAVEVLRATPRVRDLIRGGGINQLRQTMMDAPDGGGMQTFDDSFFDLYQRGLITVETALEFAESPNDLRLRLRGFAPAGRRSA
jgi:twitching motility protein PilU